MQSLPSASWGLSPILAIRLHLHEFQMSRAGCSFKWSTSSYYRGSWWGSLTWLASAQMSSSSGTACLYIISWPGFSPSAKLRGLEILELLGGRLWRRLSVIGCAVWVWRDKLCTPAIRLEEMFFDWSSWTDTKQLQERFSDWSVGTQRLRVGDIKEALQNLMTTVVRFEFLLGHIQR